MRALNYRPVCDARGGFLPWLAKLRNRSGVYVIRGASRRRTLYVGESHTGQLAKTIKRHFYPWPDGPDRKHHVYDRRAVEVAVRLTPPPTAVAAQDNLIRRLDPRDNGNGWGERPF